MDSSLPMKAGAGRLGPSAVKSAQDKDKREQERVLTEGPWRVAGSLALLAFGVTFGVALARLHWGHGGSVNPQGASQRIVVTIYESLGFVPSLYFFLLAILWGVFTFFASSIRVALCRLGIALVFVVAFASLMSLMGASGGETGYWIASRLQMGIGTAVSFLILSALTIMSALLATDWFFFSQFRRMRASLLAPGASVAAPKSRPTAERGERHDSDRGAAKAFEPSELLGDKLRPVPIPKKNVVMAADPGQRALVDLALEDARRELASSEAAGTALLEPDEDSAEHELSGADLKVGGAPSGVAPSDEDTSESEDEERTRRRLAIRARREAQRVARQEDSDGDEVSEMSPRDFREDDPSTRSAVAAPRESAPGSKGADELEAFVAEYHNEGLHPDEELGLAGLLGEPEPFADLDDDDLLAKAGEALEKQWNGGDVGFASIRPSEDSDDSDRGASDEAPREQTAERARDVEVDPFVADADRGGNDASQVEAKGLEVDEREQKGIRSWRDALEEDRGRASFPGLDAPRDDGSAADRDAGDGAQGEEDADAASDDEGFVLDPQPSRRPMPEALPDSEPAQVDSQGGGAQGDLFSDRHDSGPEDDDPFRESERGESIGRTNPSIERLRDIATSGSDAGPEDAGQGIADELDAEEALLAGDAGENELLDEAAQCVLTARRPTPSLLQRRLGLDGLEARRVLDRLAELGAVEEPADGGAWLPLLSLDDWARLRR